MTLSIMTPIIMTGNIKCLIVTISKETESIMTLRIITQSIMTISIMDLIVALSKKETIILLSKMKLSVSQHNGHYCKTQQKTERIMILSTMAPSIIAVSIKYLLVSLSKKQRE